jgi:hypothetical protein
MVMIAKEFEYVETLTGYRNGFLFTDKKVVPAERHITKEMLPQEYW